MSHGVLFGELMGVAASVFWAGTAIFFTDAGRRVGSQAVNFARLPLGLACLVLTLWATTGVPWPVHVGASAQAWLAASGVIGLTVGDGFLFWAFAKIGPRRTLLMMSTAPVFTVLTAWVLLDEVLGLRALAGIAITTGGVVVATMGRDDGGGVFRRLPRRTLRLGLLAGLAAGVCQGIGATFAKLGMASLGPLPATVLRMAWGAGAMALVALATGNLAAWTLAWRDRRAVPPLLGGVVLGPFLGVWASLAAFKYAETGVAMALTGTVPITVLLPAWLVYHDRPSATALIGTAVAVAGGVLLFLR